MIQLPQNRAELQKEMGIKQAVKGDCCKSATSGGRRSDKYRENGMQENNVYERTEWSSKKKKLGIVIEKERWAGEI